MLLQGSKQVHTLSYYGKISQSLALHFLGGAGRSLKDPRVIELEVMSSTWDWDKLE